MAIRCESFSLAQLIIFWQNIYMKSRDICLEILDAAGIPLNTSVPYGLQVRNEKLWDRVVSQRQLGLAEAYMDGWWECDAIDEFLTRLLDIDVLSFLRPRLPLYAHWVKSNFLNHQTKARATMNAKHHYNRGNDLYALMLDKEMVYSCAYWKSAENLESAQIDKLDLICRKLKLEPGMKVLDIGSGWGGFLRHATRKYGVTGVGISPADKQVDFAREHSRDLPIEFKQMDYRNLSGQYDRIVSIGMLEHVGPKNIKTFFNKCNELLVPNGMMLHHTISSNYSKSVTDQFFDKYIFPGGAIPSLAQISYAQEKLFIIEDVHNFGPYYDLTLMEWHKRIDKSWNQIPHYNERFRRMWKYYLLSSAAGFRSRELQLLQLVFRRSDSKTIYDPVR